MKSKALLWLLLIALLLFVTCDKDSGPVGPGSGQFEVQLKGSTVFPSTTGLNLSTVTVCVAENESKLETSGAYAVKALSGAPALVVAAGTDTIPLLMGVVPNPSSDQMFVLDAASTALALVYITPPVCAGLSADGEIITTKIKSLPEFQTLKTLLSQKLAANPRVLSTEDLQIETAAALVVTAYLNSLPAIPNPLGAASTGSLKKPGSLSKENSLKKSGGTSGDVIIIEPGTMTSGHELKRVDGDIYKLTNWYGRWVYCVTPEEEFFGFPNGSFLDVLRLKSPWAASERAITLSVPTSGNAVLVNVYGLGWKKETGNTWDALTDVEKNHVMRAGFSTIAFEFVPHIVSTLTNTSHVFNSTTIPKDAYVKVLAFLFNDTRTVDRCIEYYKAEDFKGLTWFLTKWVLGKLANDENFRNAYLPAIAMNLTAGKLATLVKTLHIGLKIAIAFDGVTSAIKTWTGVSSARYKTTFRLHRETTNFGNLSGSVNDKTTGSPIQGAIVDVKGDDNNPLNPPHRATTGANGAFFFENLMEGQKTVEVSKTGYASTSQSVTIVKNTTVSIAIPLSKESGKLTGRVLNDIFLKNNVTPANMKGECFLEVIEAQSGMSQGTFWVYEGSYNVTVSPGTYKVIAWQNDYVPDTVQAVVQKDGVSSAPDLTLQPIGYMSGDIYLDMDMDGTYELQYKYADSSIACIKSSDFGTCPDGVRGPVIWIGNWPPIVGLDAVGFVINLSVVGEAGAYPIGGMDMIACAGTSIAVAADFRTNRRFCQDPTGATGSMAFTCLEGGVTNPCNCGIDRPGTLYLTEYGKELTNVIQGAVTATLAGWPKCECGGGGTANCARAYISINFRTLVGAQ